MPVIVIASPKGGAGKSTTAVILGTELAHAGAHVTMLDCDPNQSLTLWSERAPMPPRMQLVNSLTLSDVIPTIQSHDQDGAVVIVDLEGVASHIMSRAISQADLVIVPMRATTLDATVGARALALIAEEEQAFKRKIRHAIVFTMTRAIRSKQHTGIAQSLVEQGVDVIEPSLMERAAFSALFEFGGDLRTIPAQGRMEGALENASAFAQAIYSRLIGETAK